ncbi:hypothetical protein M231_06189 [Tremella mesenterica]|uniref:Uncharacterized protein n=1 Tax=Tremella mesenterica TaxID=5217 RepID=A0A4V1M3D9_TREME|nr:hypothetical protein M231_06189 [Tremella mesenterica]
MISVPVYQPPDPSPSLLESVSGRHVVDSYRPGSGRSQGLLSRSGVESGGQKCGEQIMVFLEAQEENRVIQHRDSLRGLEALRGENRTLSEGQQALREGQESIQDDNRAFRNEVKDLRETNIVLSQKLDHLLDEVGRLRQENSDLKDIAEELRGDIHDLQVEQRAIPSKDDIREELQEQFATPLSELSDDIGQVRRSLESLRDTYRKMDEARTKNNTPPAITSPRQENPPAASYDSASLITNPIIDAETDSNPYALQATIW